MARNVGELHEVTLDLFYPGTEDRVNASSVTVTVTPPTGGTAVEATWTEDTPDALDVIEHIDLGAYRASWVCDAPGEWRFRIVATGVVQTVETGSFWVEPDTYSVGGMVPTIRDVARLLPQRTFVGGRKLDTFTDETNPTAAQAVDAISTATTLIRGAVGTVEEDRTGEQWDAVRKLIGALTALRAALLLATTSDPEYDRLSKEYDRMKPEVVKALQDAVSGDPVGVGEDRPATAPQWSFPCAGTTLDERY